MSKKTSRMMKTVGATLAIASAVAMVGGAKNDTSTKKMMKKTMQKVSDFVDTVSAVM